MLEQEAKKMVKNVIMFFIFGAPWGSLGYDRSLRRKVNIKSEGGGNGLLRGFASRNDKERGRNDERRSLDVLQSKTRDDRVRECVAK